MPIVAAFDPGMRTGYAVLGRDEVFAGSRALGGGPRAMGDTLLHANILVREIIDLHTPDLIAFAAPFVGMVKGRPIQPDAIYPLFAILGQIEMVARAYGIRCIEISEAQARRAFLTSVPRHSKDIKLAVMRACRARGWPCSDDHAGDALCIAARAFELCAPTASHTVTPLFSGKNHEQSSTPRQKRTRNNTRPRPPSRQI